MSGQKIIDGLRGAMAAGLDAVTIDRQRWVREPQWQPIETAPKDGSAVWLLVEGHPYLGYFDPYEAPWSKPQWFVKATFKRRLPEERLARSLPDEIYLVHGTGVSPTHWMPLPSPPKGHQP